MTIPPNSAASLFDPQRKEHVLLLDKLRCASEVARYACDDNIIRDCVNFLEVREIPFLLSLFPLRLYETIATLDKRRVSKYCVALVADYLTFMATSISGEDGSSERPFSVIRRGMGGDGAGVAAAAVALPVPAAAALQRGVFSLVSCLEPPELQHLHTVLGQGQAGARRAALANLRTQYEKSFKFEGKV